MILATKSKRTLFILLIGFSFQGCVSFHGIMHKGQDIFVTGETNYMIFQKSWVKRCRKVEDGERMLCKKVELIDSTDNIDIDAKKLDSNTEKMLNELN